MVSHPRRAAGADGGHEVLATSWPGWIVGLAGQDIGSGEDTGELVGSALRFNDGAELPQAVFELNNGIGTFGLRGNARNAADGVIERPL